MIGVPVAERSPLTSRTLEALARCGATACASPPGSVSADDLAAVGAHHVLADLSDVDAAVRAITN